MPERLALFIAGAGTEIGKTYVTAALTRRLRGQGRAVLALKPLASGVPALDDPAFAQSDTALLLAAQGLPVTADTVAACSPWRFSAPLAPDQAAAREGRRLTLDELVRWCVARLDDRSHPLPHPEVPARSVGLEGGFQNPQRSLGASFEARLRLAPQDEREGGMDGTDPNRNGPTALQPVIASGAKQSSPSRRAPRVPGLLRSARNDSAARSGPVQGVGEGGASSRPPTILIEGVGGLMSPITDDATGLDWLKALDLPALLVSGSYLGAISHALTAAETLKAHRVPLAALVVSESAQAPTPPATVAEAIARRIAAPVAVLHRNGAFPEGLAGIV